MQVLGSAVSGQYRVIRCGMEPRARSADEKGEHDVTQVKMGLWQDGLEMLGPSNPFQGTGQSIVVLMTRT